MKMVTVYRIALTFLIGFLLQGAAAAEEAKPFAEQRVVLQLSDADPQKQTLALNVAGNLLKHYGPDAVDVELVAFGPGLKLFLADNANADRIASLASSGVRFRACSNSYRHLSKKMGNEPPLHKSAKLVPAGIVEILDRVTEGYTLVRP